MKGDRLHKFAPEEASPALQLSLDMARRELLPMLIEKQKGGDPEGKVQNAIDLLNLAAQKENITPKEVETLKSFLLSAGIEKYSLDRLLE